MVNSGAVAFGFLVPFAPEYRGFPVFGRKWESRANPIPRSGRRIFHRSPGERLVHPKRRNDKPMIGRVDQSSEAMREKARFVLGAMEQRMAALGFGWEARGLGGGKPIRSY
jgi:hypothetical protein